MKIADLLGYGRESALSREELCAMTGLSDRNLRRLISFERAHGEPILSTSDGVPGYYLPEPGKAGHIDCVRFLREQELRIREIGNSCNGVQ